MTTVTVQSQPTVAPWSRVAILLVSLFAASLLSYKLTGSILPKDPKQALLFQGALLLIVLGSVIQEHKFTRPADSVVNSLMGVITLMTVYATAPRLLWWAVFSYCLLVFALSTVCTALSAGEHISGWRQKAARRTHDPAVFLGKARLIFSVIFLFGLLSFYSIQSKQTVMLILFWGLFVVLWPLRLPELISRIRWPRSSPVSIGRAIRTDWPNLVRVALSSGTEWDHEVARIYQQADGKQRFIIPLYYQSQEDRILGTALCAGYVSQPAPDLSIGHVYALPEGFELPEGEVARHLGGDESSRLVGFVVEGSSIGQIRVETWDSAACREGMVIWCLSGGARVYYQVTHGLTEEESLETDRHGFQVAVAAQLGELREKKGFLKHTWLPPMNMPVFAESETFGKDLETTAAGDFIYGTIPCSEINVGGPLADALEYHTAILGITGSGKTELAFDVIRYALQSDIKVICIDLTAKYQPRLADLKPVDLSISAALSADLSQKLFDVETGKYGAGDEKKALKDFADRLRKEIGESAATFLKATGPDSQLGLIKLEEISNTKATLYITELYLTCLLNFAKENPSECPRILIVVDEAHTVMPEPATMGQSDYDSRGLVGKIAQITLQGRKYGVGLLVIAQRTATVSKSVLTQCNTIISFACFDDTSLGFLNNIFGKTHTDLIPNLPPLHAVAFGKGVRSERPIVFKVPYDEKKAESSDVKQP